MALPQKVAAEQDKLRCTAEVSQPAKGPTARSRRPGVLLPLAVAMGSVA